MGDSDSYYEIQLTDWVKVAVRDVGGGLLVLAAAGLALLGRALQQRHQFAFQLRRGVEVHQLLARLLENVGADRVLAYEVKVGPYGWGCKLLAEVTRPNLAPLSAQEIPLELLWAEFEDLRDGKFRRYVAAGQGRCSLYLRRQGIQEQWSRLLYWRGLPVALLAVQFRSRGRRQIPSTAEVLIEELKETLRGRRRSRSTP